MQAQDLVFLMTLPEQAEGARKGLASMETY